jgi:hypothetical protein
MTQWAVPTAVPPSTAEKAALATRIVQLCGSVGVYGIPTQLLVDIFAFDIEVGDPAVGPNARDVRAAISTALASGQLTRVPDKGTELRVKAP